MFLISQNILVNNVKIAFFGGGGGGGNYPFNVMIMRFFLYVKGYMLMILPPACSYISTREN